MKLRELEKRLREEPDNLGLRITVAGALREAGRQDEAVELYRSVAIAYRDQGRTQQAIACCRSILEIAPDDVRCHALLAALVAGHKGRTAAQTGQQQILRGPSDPPVLEVGTPPPPPERRPKSESGVRPVAAERSSGFPTEETPLPEPLPYHIHDPTTRSLKRLSRRDLQTPDPDLPVSEGAKTRPGSEDGTRSGVTGLASAARRISASLIASTDKDGLYDDEDLSTELDTRKQQRIEASDLAKISQPPPTVPIDLVDLEIDEGRDTSEDEEALTPPPARGSSSGVPTTRRSEEELTTPRDLPLGRSAPAVAKPAATPLPSVRAALTGPALLASAFFRPLPSDRRDAVLTRFQRRTVIPGATVIRQGETNHALVVVARGRLEVRAEREGRMIPLATVAAGDFIGEAALLARSPASAHIVAVTDAELFMLPPRDFYEIAASFPALWAELKNVAERRTREHEAQLRR